MLNLLKGFTAPKTVERKSFTIVSNYFNSLDTIRGNEQHFIYEGNLINSIKNVKGKKKEKRMTDLNLYKYTKYERHYLGKIANNKKAFLAYIASYPTDTRLPSFETIYNNSVKEFDENGKKKPSNPTMKGDKNTPKNQVRNSNPKAEAKDNEQVLQEIKDESNQKTETLEEAVETCITLLLDFDTNEAEVANLIFKALKKRNPKLKTTSNKESVALKIA
tara:strand:+ start:896 stop:1552 length:657 start_codon:yes stop_codon:yes gene_type:complete